MKYQPSIIIFGTRGIPASHGGFETFAEQLALFLVARGWRVIVYCQVEVAVVTDRITTDRWRGIERRHVHVASAGPRGTLDFDWHCIRDAIDLPGLCLVLGYNSAVFLPYLRLHGRKILTNMDGIEWQRPKWNMAARLWLYANEWIAAWSSQRLVADHPVIADHIATRRPRSAITMIPYGDVSTGNPSAEAALALGLQPDSYMMTVARVEPDNNVLLIVEAFSRCARGRHLLVLGKLDDANPYHQRVKAAASDEVVFAGAIYDQQRVGALRFHARAYLHGHMVGGTNPSLVAALWAGNAVIAHDNPYNRWTAGEAGQFFTTADECEAAIDSVFHDDLLVERASRAAVRRAADQFGLADVLLAYEREAIALLGSTVSAPGALADAIGLITPIAQEAD